MTLSELLEELKEVDPKLYDDISHLELIGWQQPRNLAMDHLQGCLQRACERRGWGLVIERSKDSGPYEWSAYTGHEEPPGAFRAAYSWGIRYYGGSAAEALLAAYVAAIKEEKR